MPTAKGATRKAQGRGAQPQGQWRFPERLVGQGTKLLAQQCWNWGCDVRRAEGNLLLEYGFARTRPSEGHGGSSSYTLEPTSGTQLVLWSFGVFYGCAPHGGLFLNRFRFEPLLLEQAVLPASISELEALPPLHRSGLDECAQLASLLTGLLAWIVAYERAVEAGPGLDYRAACLAQWSRQRLALPAAVLVPAWEALAHDCDHTLAETAHGEGVVRKRP